MIRGPRDCYYIEDISWVKLADWSHSYSVFIFDNMVLVNLIAGACTIGGVGLYFRKVVPVFV
jgi:hypothetical protein